MAGVVRREAAPTLRKSFFFGSTAGSKIEENFPIIMWGAITRVGVH